MIPLDAVANEILLKAVAAVKTGDRLQLRALDTFPIAIYVTDIDGLITYFNPACVEFAGRTPRLNRDRWCVTWKLYTSEGGFLPHERCPMALAIQTRRSIRGAAAMAERPNGFRLRFLPFPTPVIGDNGELLGAVNMLVDISGDSGMALRNRRQISQSERVKQALQTFTMLEIRALVEEIETALGERPPRILN